MAAKSPARWITALLVVLGLVALGFYILSRPSDPDPQDVIDVEGVSFRDGVITVALRCDLERFARGARQKTEPGSRAERYMLRVGLAPVDVQPELNAGLDRETVVLETDILEGWAFRPDEIVTEYSVRRSFEAPLEGVEVFSVPLTVPLLESRYVGGTYNVVAEAVFRARHATPGRSHVYEGTVGREVVPVTVPGQPAGEGVGWKREQRNIRKVEGGSIDIAGKATLTIPKDSLEKDSTITLDLVFNGEAVTVLYGSAVEGRHECARRAYSGGPPLAVPATLRILYGELGEWEDLALIDPFGWLTDRPSLRETARVDPSTRTLTVSLTRTGGMVQVIRDPP